MINRGFQKEFERRMWELENFPPTKTLQSSISHPLDSAINFSPTPEQVQDIKDANGWTYEDLSKILGVNKPSIQHYLNCTSIGVRMVYSDWIKLVEASKSGKKPNWSDY